MDCESEKPKPPQRKNLEGRLETYEFCKSIKLSQRVSFDPSSD